MTSRASALPKLPAHGLTLVELLVVVAIVAILAGLALPGFGNAIARQRVRNAGDELATALYLARAEAIRRGGQSVLRKSEAPDCTAPSARNWSCGWMVFADLDDDGAFGPGDEPIQAWPAPRGVEVTTNAPAPAEWLAFDRWGRFRGLGAFRFNFRPLSGTDPAAMSVLCVSAGGRLQSLRGTEKC